MAFDFDKNINTELGSLISSTDMFHLLVNDFNEKTGMNTGIHYNMENKTITVNEVIVLPMKCYTNFLKLMLAHEDVTKEAVMHVNIDSGIKFYNWICTPDLSDLKEAFDFANTFWKTPVLAKVMHIDVLTQIKKLAKKDATSIFDMIQNRYWDNGLYFNVSITDDILSSIAKMSKKDFNVPKKPNSFTKIIKDKENTC